MKKLITIQVECDDHALDLMKTMNKTEADLIREWLDQQLNIDGSPLGVDLTTLDIMWDAYSRDEFIHTFAEHMLQYYAKEWFESMSGIVDGQWFSLWDSDSNDWVYVAAYDSYYDYEEWDENDSGLGGLVEYYGRWDKKDLAQCILQGEFAYELITGEASVPRSIS